MNEQTLTKIRKYVIFSHTLERYIRVVRAGSPLSAVLHPTNLDPYEREVDIWEPCSAEDDRVEFSLYCVTDPDWNPQSGPSVMDPITDERVRKSCSYEGSYRLAEPPAHPDITADREGLLDLAVSDKIHVDAGNRVNEGILLSECQVAEDILDLLQNGKVGKSAARKRMRDLQSEERATIAEIERLDAVNRIRSGEWE